VEDKKPNIGVVLMTVNYSLTTLLKSFLLLAFSKSVLRLEFCVNRQLSTANVSQSEEDATSTEQEQRLEENSSQVGSTHLATNFKYFVSGISPPHPIELRGVSRAHSR